MAGYPLHTWIYIFPPNGHLNVLHLSAYGKDLDITDYQIC